MNCSLETRARSHFVDVTDRVGEAVVFVPHTTAGGTIDENAESDGRPAMCYHGGRNTIMRFQP